MPRMRPCWSCGAQDQECYSGCSCARCVDPENYEAWRRDNPEKYKDWLKSQKCDGSDSDYQPYRPFRRQYTRRRHHSEGIKPRIIDIPNFPF
jgi:hypothetical protein